MDKLGALRQLFPHTERLIYFNHAATAPHSKRVVDALNAFIEERHETLVENYEEFMPTIHDTLVRAGEVLGVNSRQVAFMPNTSYALNVLAQGLDWQPGDRIIIPGCEFPANVYPFLNLQNQGVAVDFVPHKEGQFSLADVEAALTPRTRMLTLSWVQFLSGYKIDLKEVGAFCKTHDLVFCVDAIQGVGALKMEAEAWGIDFLASGGHKWMMAAQGIGLMYVKPELQERLTSWAGWMHGPIDWERLTDYRLAFHPDARRFRLGTINSMGVAAMHASLGLYLETGRDWCNDRVLALSSRLAEGLTGMGLVRYGSDDMKHASGIVTVQHPNANQAYAQLKAAGIQGAMRNGLLRFSPTFYNTEDEVDRVIEAVAGLGL